MKNVPAVRTALENSDVIKAIPELTIDWNMNRYVGATADNTPSEQDEGFDIEFFPIESIGEPLRPTKGINKARVGSATIGDDYLIGNKATPNGRFYVANVEDIYKYWTSPYASDAATGALTSCAPQVLYNSAVRVNKIVLTFENTWASPKTFSVQTTTVAAPLDTDWVEIANETGLGNAWKGRGQIVLYWNGIDWTGTVPIEDNTLPTIWGVRVVVTALEGGYKVTDDGSAVPSTYSEYVNGALTTKNTTGLDARLDLIEISARLEVDLSDHLIDVAETFDMGEVDELYPIGTLTSNAATVTLSNLYFDGTDWVPGLFDADNIASPYYNLIDANAEVKMQYRFFDENEVELGVVPQFKMYTEPWNGQSDDIVNIELKDHSKFFNEQVMPSAMWEQLTVPEIVWRLLDSVGFVDYNIDQDADRVTEHVIPVFYTDGEQTLWEILDDLAKASQTAIYFDASGVLQVKTRDFAFSSADGPVWRFTAGVPADTKLSDIISLDKTGELQPNHYKIIYQKTNWSDENRAGQPTLQKVWEPEDTEVLRGTPLYKSLAVGDQFFWLSPKDVKVWPYEGLVNIDGELIRYKGKQYIYYTGANGGTRNTRLIENQADFIARNNQTPVDFRHKNHFTGQLKITERGVWNSEEKSHDVEAQGYSVRHVVNGTRRTGVTGFRHLRHKSKVVLNTPRRLKDYKDILVATRGQADDTAFFHYGTKLRFDKGAGNPTQCAGILIHNNATDEDGYYIELTPSKRLNAKERKKRQEVILYSRVNGKDRRIGGNGRAFPIGEDIDYEVDVTFTSPGTDHKIQVWINGRNCLTETISGTDKNAANGRFGLFARGKTKVEFEYLYGIRREDPEPPDDFSFLDKVYGGYVGQRWEREWVFKWHDYRRRTKKGWRKARKRWNQMIFDDFGPYVHEIREYDVHFDPAPVLHSRLYNTNDWSSAILDYRATPFGAKFTIANTDRQNAVLNGDDALSHPGTRESVSQILTVFGRALVTEESEEVVAKNDDQIRRRGKIESEISSPWIQSKAMADDLKDWLVDNFSTGNDEISLEVFGNPLIEVADVVTVDYPEKNVNGDFFVLGAENSFENGISTTLTLRRRKV